LFTVKALHPLQAPRNATHNDVTRGSPGDGLQTVRSGQCNARCVHVACGHFTVADAVVKEPYAYVSSTTENEGRNSLFRCRGVLGSNLTLGLFFLVQALWYQVRNFNFEFNLEFLESEFFKKNQVAAVLIRVKKYLNLSIFFIGHRRKDVTTSFLVVAWVYRNPESFFCHENPE
jgi:hypothetical protein